MGKKNPKGAYVPENADFGDFFYCGLRAFMQRTELYGPSPSMTIDRPKPVFPDFAPQLPSRRDLLTFAQ
jgi:hypothetical protein